MFGEILKELRTKKGVTQSDMAQLLNITRQAYGNYETNTSSPDIKTLSMLADYFCVSADLLLGRKIETPRNQPLTESETDLLEVFRRANKNPKLEQRAIGVLENYFDKYSPVGVEKNCTKPKRKWAIVFVYLLVGWYIIVE